MDIYETGVDLEIPDVDITSFVLERVGEWEDQIALVDGSSGREITYAGLRDAIRSLAAGLATRGFGKGDTFAVYMPNLPEYAIAFHGVASAGGRCTTTNPLYTAPELHHQIHDSGARMLLTIPQLVETATAACDGTEVTEIFVLGESVGATPFSKLLGDPSIAPDVEIQPAVDLAALPYSSGTTGLPKGVMLTHRNLVANLLQSQGTLKLERGEVLVGVLPFFHIYGMTVIMNLGLRFGATIVTMPRFDLDKFLGLIESRRITRAFVVPPIAVALAKHPAVDQHDLSSLEMIMSGAAPLGAELSDQVTERIGCAVMQGYGMTETSPVTHIVPLDRTKPGSIGLPVAATECRLVDSATGVDAGEGERGELWIRGPQVMAGYLNNAESTDATIDPDGWLKTGDIAVRDEDGYFAIVDRLKELIKYKGYQVAPAELEALLIGHPGVQDVAVIGIPDQEAGELPKAFIVAATDDLDTDELVNWAAEQLSPQKRIRLVEVVDEIPKSASGKILRRVLAER